MDIEGSVVLITGASSGIGAATARAASRAGARVVLLARREDRVKQLAEELGDALPLRCDVTDEGDVRAAVDTAIGALGRIDVLVNNAGQGLQATIEEIEPGDFRAILDLNVVAPLLMMQAVLPAMRDQGAGSIVNVSSGTTFADVPGTGAYVASKIALERLSAIARAELADAGIAVSTVIPFATSTEFMDAIRAGKQAAQDMTAGVDFHSPDRVADAILHLIASGEAQLDLVPQAFGGSLPE
jgi:NADP-dependent 3-hydroxy acid dehydrogenase YdfG